MAMPRRAAVVGVSVTASPAKTIDPPSGRVVPDATFISVDLPAPFSPRMACTSPARIAIDTSDRAGAPPHHLHTGRAPARIAIDTSDRAGTPAYTFEMCARLITARGRGATSTTCG